MTFCKENTKLGKRCKSHCLRSFDFCWSHSPDCVICQEKLVSEQIQELHCGHMFHNDCIEKWTDNNSTCPICRKLTDHQLIFDENISPSNLTSDFMSQLVLNMMNLPSTPIRVNVHMTVEGLPFFRVD
jgi:hypothetical protein